MMIMRKFNLIYILTFIVLSFLSMSLTFKENRTITFYGFAENKETEINMEHPIEIEKIYVTTGQKVKKGEVLLDVLSSELPVEIGNTNYKIEELQTKYQLWKTDLDWKITQYNIELNEKTNAIQSQIDLYQSQLDQNKILAQNIQSISIDDLESGEIQNPVYLKIAALKKNLEFNRGIIGTQISNLKSERFAENNPLLSQIKALAGEMQYFENKEQKQTIVAPSDGLVGNIHCKDDENVAAFDVLITFYDESPKLVVGYIHEDFLLKVNLNDSVAISSTSRPGIRTKGMVKNTGSRIIEIPSRLRKFKEYITYGREIIIEIPSDNPFLQKEKVTLNLKN